MANIRKTEKWTFSLTLVVALAGATLLGGFYGNQLSGAPTPTELHKRLKEYTDLLNAVSTWAPEEVASDKFVFSSIDGMLRTLDPHTSFLEPKEYSDMQDRQKGTFYGLGILVTKRNDQVTVITPLEGTPAARLGIRAGDVIVGLSSSGKATYEHEYNGGMGSNGLTSARHDVFTHAYAERYPESFDPAVPDDLVYTGAYNVTVAGSTR